MCQCHFTWAGLIIEFKNGSEIGFAVIMEEKVVHSLVWICTESMSWETKEKILDKFCFKHPIFHEVALYVAETKPQSELALKVSQKLPWNRSRKIDFERHWAKWKLKHLPFRLTSSWAKWKPRHLPFRLMSVWAKQKLKLMLFHPPLLLVAWWKSKQTHCGRRLIWMKK